MCVLEEVGVQEIINDGTRQEKNDQIWSRYIKYWSQYMECNLSERSACAAIGMQAET